MEEAPGMANREAARPLPPSPRLYQAFGFCLRSPIDLPELVAAPAGVLPDVEIRFGSVPPALPGGTLAEPFIHVAAGTCLIAAPPARILVSDGETIEVDPAPGASGSDIRPYLLGSALGVLCHQRGLMPLHASSAFIGERAVAFAGPSGAGKSTLAAGLRRAGFSVLADDICAIRFQGDHPIVSPGLTRLKLSAESLRLLDVRIDRLEPVGGGVGKYNLLANAAAVAPGSARLGTVCLLRRAAEGPAQVRRLTGAQAASAVLGDIYRWRTAAALGLARSLLDRAVLLARVCEVFEAVGPLDPAAPFRRQEVVLAALGAEARANSSSVRNGGGSGYDREPAKLGLGDGGPGRGSDERG
jgi:hypothetical protein